MAAVLDLSPEELLLKYDRGELFSDQPFSYPGRNELVTQPRIRVSTSIFNDVLAGANLEEARLQEAELATLDLTGVNLRNAALGSANLSGSILREARLQEARMMRADLRNTNLDDANLTRADLFRSEMGGARLDRTVLVNAQLRSIDFSGTWFGNTDMRGANVSYSTFALSPEFESIIWADDEHPFNVSNYQGTVLFVDGKGYDFVDAFGAFDAMGKAQANGTEAELTAYFEGVMKQRADQRFDTAKTLTKITEPTTR